MLLPLLPLDGYRNRFLVMGPGQNPQAVAGRNPGYCFQKAGWRRCGVTKGGLLIFEKVMQ